MLSLELARKLKEAGLPWNVTIYDFCYYQERLYVVTFAFIDKVIISAGVRVDISKCVFAPRLDQLLAEIEQQGYSWHLYTYTLPIAKTTSYACEVFKFGKPIFTSNGCTFAGSSTGPEDATAQALIWILEREKGAKPGDPSIP